MIQEVYEGYIQTSWPIEMWQNMKPLPLNCPAKSGTTAIIKGSMHSAVAGTAGGPDVGPGVWFGANVDICGDEEEKAFGGSGDEDGVVIGCTMDANARAPLTLREIAALITGTGEEEVWKAEERGRTTRGGGLRER